jgi:hypothetical protein
MPTGFIALNRSRKMDIETAKQVMQRIEKCVQLLSEIVQVADTNCDEIESKIVRRGVGYVLSEIQDRLSDPVLREHIELVPQSVDYRPGIGPTLRELAVKAGIAGS